MQTADIQRRWLTFFGERGHTVVPSASLVSDDPSLLFTVAGMVPFIPYFTGVVPAPYPRATSVQKCIRTNDIEEVGKTPRHGTFFQMNGNFSFGDYFKEGAIGYAWELLTTPESAGGLGFDEKDLWVTVYEEDDEARKLWKSVAGLSDDRIQNLGKDSNYWSTGQPGPAGPCSEIFFDRGPAYGADGGPATDDDRYVEIWNLVFMQYAIQNVRSKVDFDIVGELPKKNIDTGMGMERVAFIKQGVDNMYEIDQVRPVLDAAVELSGKKYGADHGDDVRFRVIADHVRSGLMLMTDGVAPGQQPVGEAEEPVGQVGPALEVREGGVPDGEVLLPGRPVHLGQRGVGRRPVGEPGLAVDEGPHPAVGEGEPAAGEDQVLREGPLQQVLDVLTGGREQHVRPVGDGDRRHQQRVTFLGPQRVEPGAEEGPEHGRDGQRVGQHRRAGELLGGQEAGRLEERRGVAAQQVGELGSDMGRDGQTLALAQQRDGVLGAQGRDAPQLDRMGERRERGALGGGGEQHHPDPALGQQVPQRVGARGSRRWRPSSARTTVADPAAATRASVSRAATTSAGSVGSPSAGRPVRAATCRSTWRRKPPVRSASASAWQRTISGTGWAGCRASRSRIVSSVTVAPTPVSPVHTTAPWPVATAARACSISWSRAEPRAGLRAGTGSVVTGGRTMDTADLPSAHVLVARSGPMLVGRGSGVRPSVAGPRMPRRRFPPRG